MNEKKQNSLVLNKKVISRLNQSLIIGGVESLEEDFTGFTICTNSPASRTCARQCQPTKTISPLPATSGCDTQTDIPTRYTCA